MEGKVVVFCRNTETSAEYTEGVSVSEIQRKLNLQMNTPILGVLVNNRLRNLNYRIYSPKTIEFVEMRSEMGLRIYSRTMWMIFAMALRDVCSEATMRIEYPISYGFFCTIHGTSCTESLIHLVRDRMQDIIRCNMKIEMCEERTDVVAERFREFGAFETAKLLSTVNRQYSRYYRIDNYIDYYTYILAPSTGYVTTFDLIPYEDGVLLVLPDINDMNTPGKVFKSPKVFKAHRDFNEWNRLMGMNNVGDFNEICRNGGIRQMLKLSESLHEKRIAEIADTIVEHHPKFILIAGPSSSGKTTFSKRLEIQLRITGINPLVLSVDDFFVDREFTPRDENGDYDFEHLNALDLDLLDRTLNGLLRGDEVEIPQYNFADGKKHFNGKKLRMTERSVVVMEGIHALNPDMIPNIPQDAVFRIFVEPSTSVPFDNHNWAAPSDIRLARRILRDYKFRAYSAQNTIRRWPSVRRGEMRWIYPFQENADVIFNSALIFELAVLRNYVEPLLRQVPEASDEYATARRLLDYFDYYELVSDREIPPTSLLREFVGGSSFHY
ncbi:MAG: nucleoside kinase [Paludibacteraceae bacterium]|nr:nucleoside kinase [Paludibacteraceae bacterium]